MKILLSCFLLLSALMLLGNEAETNIYPNPVYKNWINPQKKFIVDSHWGSDKLAVGGKYKNHTALKLIPLKYPWGYSGIISSVPIKLAPGRYCLSVWCRHDKQDEKDLTQFSIIRKTAGKGKKASQIRHYRESDRPAAGKWIELVLMFEVKPGEGSSVFQYGHYSRTKLMTALYAAPRLVKMEE